MNGPAHAPLDQALQLGTLMLGAARQREWAIVAGMNPDYDAAIRAGASAARSSPDLLLQIEQQHRQIVQLAAQARDGVAQELERQRHNHRALSAYLDSSATG
ncbi:MAG: hypothetical protein KGM46_00915 [Pseudomonadota bacterium]|jgi:hypothetical protein|nr:hypothetical protein [Xanthomonadaceae bacterium]MDE2247446.1 hypothetical protein [Xanthomonadaceae bacterium]MDE3209286.1 hypothetical protein [Pseudomonadota bacterium]